MNEENTNTRNRPSKLEQLKPEVQTWILEIATHSRLVDLMETLKENGIETSASSLSRFIREHKERELVEAGEQSKGTVEALAERGRNGKLREGTLEAVRQRLYERTLVSQNPEEALKLYGEFVKEEAKLREIELEARKVAALEQQVKLQGLRIEVEMAKARQGRAVKTAEVVESAAVVANGGELANGGADASKIGTPEIAGSEVRAGQAGDSRAENRLVLVLREVSEIANRGGAPEERILELRARLAEGMKVFEANGG